jgi:hypothetical protein
MANICRECQLIIDNPATLNTLLHGECKTARKNKRDKARQKALSLAPIGDELICPGCNRPFVKVQAAQVFCDTSCQYAAKLAAGRKEKQEKTMQKIEARKLERQKQEVEDLLWPEPEAPSLHPMAVWFVSFNWRINAEEIPIDA